MDINRLFLDPKVTQEGSHMVMTGVNRPQKTQTLNIDTRFCDTVNHSTAFDLSLPEKINNIKSLQILEIDLLRSWFNFSQSLQNVSLLVSYSANFATYTLLSIPDMQYSSVPDLVTALNTAVASAVADDSTSAANYLTFGYLCKSSAYQCTITSSSSATTIYIRFIPNSAAWSVASLTSAANTSDKYNLKQQLGWKLGFRQTLYSLDTTTTTITSEGWIDIAGPLYAFLALEPFANISSRGIVSQYPTSLASKTIVARIPLATSTYGDYLTSTPLNGLVTQKLAFDIPGGVSIQRIRFQLTDEFGNPIDTQNMGFCFTCCLLQE